MALISDPVSAGIDLAGKLIDRFIPDATLAAQAKAEIMRMQQSGELAQVADIYADVNNARGLAGQEIAKSNPFTSSLAAIVRPLWGIGAFLLVAYYALTHATIDLALQNIILTVIEFYFGGRVIEKVTPHVSQTISNLKG